MKESSNYQLRNNITKEILSTTPTNIEDGSSLQPQPIIDSTWPATIDAHYILVTPQTKLKLKLY